MKKVLYKIELPEKVNRYVFHYIFSVLGIEAEEVFDDSKPDILYSAEIQSTDVKLAFKFNPDDFVWKEFIEGPVNPSDFGNICPFDLINAIKSFITDEVNKNIPVSGFDQTDRLILTESFQFKNNIHELPLVNAYILFFKELIKSKLNINEFRPLWKDNRKYAIGLSHDVDFPDKYAPRYAPLYIPGSSVSKNIRMFQKKLTAAIRRKLDPSPDNHWLFRQIMDSESQFGFKSTFFFATVSKFDPYGSIEDVNYGIRNYRFKNIISEILSRNFEVGLHTSFNAFHDPKRIENEVKILENISGSKVLGNRHHGWHMGRNTERTWKFHELAGLSYDSSTGYNEHMGFRRSIALPYYPWNSTEDRAFNVMQLPVFCMDGNLFYKPVKTEDAIEQIIKYIQIIKKNNGAAMMNWHVRTSFPVNNHFTEWGKAYQEILKYLSNDSEVWVTSHEEIYQWMKERLLNN